MKDFDFFHINANGSKCYYLNNNLHKLNGPSLESKLGNKSYYLFGNKYLQYYKESNIVQLIFTSIFYDVGYSDYFNIIYNNIENLLSSGAILKCYFVLPRFLENINNVRTKSFIIDNDELLFFKNNNGKCPCGLIKEYCDYHK